MDRKKIHIYFVPGLAAGPEIFRNIHLDTERYQIHILKWKIPQAGESISVYAQRMCDDITEKDPVLIGVSFGGVMAQEMSYLMQVRKLIIISSVKSKNELPTRIRIARKTGLYKMVPTGLVLSSEDLTKYAIGPKTEKRLKIYQEYLHVRDKRYLDWAIKQMVCWDREQYPKDMVHIHGTKDVVFPVKYLNEYIPIPGGTHVMILNKGKKITEKLEEILQNI